MSNHLQRWRGIHTKVGSGDSSRSHGENGLLGEQNIGVVLLLDVETVRDTDDDSAGQARVQVNMRTRRVYK